MARTLPAGRLLERVQHRIADMRVGGGNVLTFHKS
jgi:hypothetical protein